ncbi:MAG: hypothetical protein ACNA8L_05095 [Luteolibacter sp.]
MKQNTKPLRVALFGNAAFSAMSAIILIMFPDMVASHIGATNHMLLMAIGIGLGVFSLDLFHQASRQRMQTWRALYASLGDATWVLGTVILLIWFPNLVSEKGSAILIFIALIVALFGALQLWGAGEAHRLKGTKLYRHCVAVTVPQSVDMMWEAVSDLAGISKYFPALRSSTIRGDVEPQVGAIRQCEDHSGKRWAEKCTKFEIGKRIELEFLCNEEGFPYPASEMIGGWSLLKHRNGSTQVHIWWHLKPKPNFMAPLILPLLGLKADIDFPPLVFRMAGCESHQKIAQSTLGRLILPAHSC